MTQAAMDIDSRTLPADWKWVKLEDVVHIIGGGTPSRSEPSYWGGDLPWVSVKDMNVSVLTHTSEYITPEGLDSSASNWIDAGNVIVATRVGLGKVCANEVGVSINQDLKGLIPKNSGALDTDYLFYNMQSHAPLIISMGTGSTVKGIRTGELAGINIPLPSLEEQKRIAAILNEQMATVEKAKKAAEERLEAAKALPAAYLREVFEGIVPISVETTPGDSPEGWKWQLLTDVARLESGHTPSRKHPEYWENGDIPWLALPDIRALDGRYCETTSENTNELGIKNSSARILPEGTVALSRTASVGFTTIFGRPMATSQDFVNWVCSNDLLPEFLLLALISSRDYIRNLSSGATHKTVYVPTVKSFKICMPNPSVQEQVSEEYLGNRDSLNPISANIEQELETIEAMPAALLRKAFSGEL